MVPKGAGTEQQKTADAVEENTSGGGSFGVLAVISAVLLVLNSQKEKELDELLTFNTDPGNVAAYQDSLALEAKVGRLLATMEEVGGFTEAKDSYPWADSAVTAAVERAAGNAVDVTVNSYQAVTGSLLMTAEAADVTIINGYIDALENTGLFEKVEYSGYHLIEKEEKQRYSINVICHLTAEAGK